MIVRRWTSSTISITRTAAPACVVRVALPQLQQLLGNARGAQITVIYANDAVDLFDGDTGAIIARAKSGAAAAAVAAMKPLKGDRFFVKPRYSAFDSSPSVDSRTDRDRTHTARGTHD